MLSSRMITSHCPSISELLSERRVLRRQMLFAATNTEHQQLLLRLKELDKKIPWITYKISVGPSKLDKGGFRIFQHLDPDLDKKPLSKWTDQELGVFPWTIENPELATISKV